MTTAFLVTLLIGIALGVAMGVPMGRFFERIRPSKRDDDEGLDGGTKKRKKKR